jgi:hypothetical protein
MALYVNSTVVQKVGAQDAFTSTYKPGNTVPHSGIYRCDVCGDEDCCNAGDPFPPQNHAQHKNKEAITWRLLVYAQQVA